ANSVCSAQLMPSPPNMKAVLTWLVPDSVVGQVFNLPADFQSATACKAAKAQGFETPTCPSLWLSFRSSGGGKRPAARIAAPRQKQELPADPLHPIPPLQSSANRKDRADKREPHPHPELIGRCFDSCVDTSRDVRSRWHEVRRVLRPEESIPRSRGV